MTSGIFNILLTTKVNFGIGRKFLLFMFFALVHFFPVLMAIMLGLVLAFKLVICSLFYSPRDTMSDERWVATPRTCLEGLPYFGFALAFCQLIKWVFSSWSHLVLYLLAPGCSLILKPLFCYIISCTLQNSAQIWPPSLSHLGIFSPNKVISLWISVALYLCLMLGT